MSQHDFNIANQLFPATRADLNNAFVALASNSSGDAEPGTTYANQWWYETDTNTLKLRNEANSAWIEIATLDQSSNNVLSITTQGLTLGATAITASGTEINLLNDLTRGSIIYGNASGVTSELVKGSANTVLTSDGTDISWSAGPPALTRGQIIYSNSSGTTVALAPGTADQVLTSDGTDISWAATGSSNPYTALSTAATGYITLVGGLIIQWGKSGSIGTGGTSTVTFATTFPNACRSVAMSPHAAGTANSFAWASGAPSTSNVTFYSRGGVTATGVYYIAIGY